MPALQGKRPSWSHPNRPPRPSMRATAGGGRSNPSASTDLIQARTGRRNESIANSDRPRTVGSAAYHDAGTGLSPRPSLVQQPSIASLLGKGTVSRETSVSVAGRFNGLLGPRWSPKGTVRTTEWDAVGTGAFGTVVHRATDVRPHHPQEAPPLQPPPLLRTRSFEVQAWLRDCRPQNSAPGSAPCNPTQNHRSLGSRSTSGAGIPTDYAGS